MTSHAAAARESGEGPARHRADLVSAPVRIADAGAARLLRPGDRVDVLAAAGSAEPRVVARGARVAQVPGARADAADRAADDAAASGGLADGDLTDGGLAGEVGSGVGEGALVVLAVPRATAATLAGASVTARLAVTLC
ncbi:hypothetical protein [Streptomyces sp. SAJ15]|uniref:hypothetical protein n=1 Tax=Streptomyces sp. SAJ15 TaxID=2011095 RepID=UPI0028CB1C1A|nr:hypothetical protein [Streptomyces sp. SAJ15]